MIWQILNSFGALAVGALTAYILAAYGHRAHLLERMGLGLTGAGSVLTIGPVMVTDGSPYDNWSGAMLRVGIALLLYAWILRRSRMESISG